MSCPGKMSCANWFLFHLNAICSPSGEKEGDSATPGRDVSGTAINGTCCALLVLLSTAHRIQDVMSRTPIVRNPTLDQRAFRWPASANSFESTGAGVLTPVSDGSVDV